MKPHPIIYWIATALIAFVFLSSGAAELARPSTMMQGMAHLGYPAYFVTILGVWKLLGGITLLIPRTPLLKEWAYAGMFFDLTGASASHASSGDPLAKVLIPLIITIILIVSWALRPAGRKLSAKTPRPDAAASGV